MKKTLALLTLASSLVLANVSQAAMADFLGTWSNSNRSTKNIVSLTITPSNELQLFGACTPSPCDMGKVPLVTYGRTVSDTNHMAATAMYDLKFKKMFVTIKVLGKKHLYVETYSQFTDGSGRQNYWVGESFTK